LPANQRIALKLPDAAATLDTSLGTLEKLIAAGEIPITRVNGDRRVMWQDLNAYCLRNRDPDYPVPVPAGRWIV
jgi:excisionase family DNA binding protein